MTEFTAALLPVCGTRYRLPAQLVPVAVVTVPQP